MKRTLKRKTGLLLLGILMLAFSRDAVASATLTKDAGPTAFDYRTGKWYIGAGAAAALTQTLASVGPANTTGTVTITPLMSATATNYNVAQTAIAVTPNSTNDGTTVITAATALTTISSHVNPTGADDQTADSAALKDAGAATIAGGVVALAAKPNMVFALVKANGGAFGAAGNGGIAVCDLTDAGAITQKNATAGGATATGYKLDTASNEVDGNAGTAVMIDNTGVLHWAPGLERLYTGVQVTSGGTNGNCAISVQCYSVAEDDWKITNVQLNTDLDGYGTAEAATSNNFIGVLAANTQAAATVVNNLSVMHTSTDKYYLIVNGDAAANETAADLTALARNKVWALPLVGPAGDNPGALATVIESGDTVKTDGSSIVKNAPLIDFNRRANGASELFDADDIAARVGAGLIPVATGSATEGIDHMQVVGDTVYVAVTTDTVDATAEGGVYFSQAIFNESGAITSWTEWEKHVPNISSGTSATDGSCWRVAVDPVRGKTFTIQDDDKQTIKQTYWQKETTTASTYGGQINTLLDGPCYSKLYLNASMLGVGDKVVGTYCLFGGDAKMVAIKVGTRGSVGHDEEETPVNDWDAATSAAVSLSTGLPSGSKVTSLGFIQNDIGTGAGDYHFFLAGVENAGTNDGLYQLGVTDATATNQLGFNAVDDLINTNAGALFSTSRTWYKLSTVTGKVLKIIGEGGTAQICAVLTKETNANGTNAVYTVGGDNDHTTDLNAAIVKIATAGTGDFADVTRFYDAFFVPIPGTSAETLTDTIFQLAIATDKGLYISTVGSGVVIGTTAAAANFVKWTPTESFYGNFFRPVRTREPLTFWGTRHVWDPTGARKVQIQQLISGVADSVSDASLAGQGTLVAKNVTSNDMLPEYAIRTPYLNSLVIDGVSRFILEEHHDRAKRKAYVLPYETSTVANFKQANITAPTEIEDTVIKDKNVHWMGRIGAGYFGAGTDDGLHYLI